MTLWTKLFGPSLKSRLLDQLDLQARQASADRLAWREALSEQGERNIAAQHQIVQLVGTLAASVTEQSKSFNRYLDLVTPHGEPTLHHTNDAHAAKLEADYLKEHSMEGLIDLGVPIAGPMADILHHQDTLAADLSAFLRD